MGYIYLITNTVNGKQYVGQTQREDIHMRWKQHKCCDSKSIGTYIARAYKKYGIEKFKFQIICICFDEACNDFEIEYIKKFNTLAPNGYNLESGGGNSKHHPDTKKKISEASKGRKASDATRAKISLNSPNRGKKFTEEEIQALSLAKKKMWQKKRDDGTYDDFVKKVYSDRKNEGMFKKGQGQIFDNRKPVGKYDKDGTLLETFTSAVDAGKQTSINGSTISAVCRQNGKNKTAGGYIWKFI
jgi:group I intron endonuclease